MRILEHMNTHNAPRIIILNNDSLMFRLDDNSAAFSRFILMDLRGICLHSAIITQVFLIWENNIKHSHTMVSPYTGSPDLKVHLSRW